MRLCCGTHRCRPLLAAEQVREASLSSGRILCIGVLKIDTPDLKKYLASRPLQRYNTPNLNMKKSPSGQAAAAGAAPGQEGLFDHMFDHRQRRSTRKQWN